MADDEPYRPAVPPRKLTVAEITFLGSLGDMFHAAPGYRAAQDALDMALKYALRHRNEGVGWEEITRALGIDQGELRHRLQETTDKPRPLIPSPTPPPVIGSPPPQDRAHAPDIRVSALLSASQSQSSSISQPSAQNATFSAHIRPTSPGGGSTPSPLGTSRRVLFLSGDPRPGRNEFGPEAAYIRRVLTGSFVDVVELSCVELPEICAALDRHSPAVLHIAAHRSVQGVHLSQEGGDLCVAHKAFCEQIARARTPPRLAVLSFCDSFVLAEEVAQTITSVISWPCPIDDQQAQPFAQQLYRSLATRRTISESCKDAEAALSRRPPALSPNLHGDPTTVIF